MFFVNASDGQNASVQNVTDWRVNNVSIATVYAPFETNTNGTPTNIIRSYSTNVTTTPDDPARAVRPDRCRYVLWSMGGS